MMDLTVLNGLTKVKVKEEVDRFYKKLAMISFHQKGNPPYGLTHYFSPGVYVREIRVSREILVITKMIKEDHVVILSSGRVLILNEDGSTIERTAPCTWTSKAGARRVVLVKEDCTWTTIHSNPTDEINVDILEERLSVDEMAKELVCHSMV